MKKKSLFFSRSPKNLFAISKTDGSANTAGLDAGGGGGAAARTLYRSRLLRLRPCNIPVARLNGECARQFPKKYFFVVQYSNSNLT